ncbi:phage tail protein [Lactococcus lactis]|uniref:phage tail protein n=1 Tax=Lactococcus lactis TaxID=1358 RepID=UPI00240FDD15|nr:phage tail tape measure protein [Lactococcus lactis]
MANDGAVVIDVLLDSAKAMTEYNKLGSVMSGTGSKIGSALKAGTAAAIAGTAAVGVAAVGIGKQVLASYADYEQLVGGVDTLFGNASKTVQGFADNAYKTAGLSANAYMETVTGFSASMVASLKGDTAKAADYSNQAVVDMADNANKMGSNIGDIQNAYQGFAKQNYTMLDNLKLGYGGTQEEMKRLLSDAEKFSGQKYDISSFADVTQAIHVVQTQMGITGTTAKEAASTISGSIDSTKAAYQNLITGLGSSNANIKQLVDNLMGSLTNVINNITPIIGNLITALPPVITGLLSSIAKLLPTLFSTIASLFGTLLSTIVKLLPTVIPSFVQGILQIVNAIIQNLPMIINAGIQIIMALVQGLVQALPTLIPQIVQAVLLIVNTLTQNLPLLITAAIQIIVAIVTGLAQAIPQLIPAIVNAVFVMVDALITNLPLLLSASIQIILAIIKGIVQALPQLLSQMEKTIPLLVNTIINNLPMLINAAIQIILALISGFVSATPQILSSMNRIMNNLISTIAGKVGEFLSKGVQIIGSFVNGIISGKNPVDVFKNFIKDISGLFGLDTLYEQGSAIISGFFNGLKDKFEDVKSWVGGIGKWISDHKGPISYDRRLLIPHGGSIMEGLDEGLQDKFKKVQANVSSMANKLADSLTGGLPSLDTALNATVTGSSTFSQSQQANSNSSNLASKVDRMADKIDEMNKRKIILDINGKPFAEAVYDDFKKVSDTKTTIADLLNF